MAAARVNKPVNLCTGIPLTFNQLAAVVAGVVGYKPKLKVEHARPKGVAYRVGNPYQMSEFYQPKITVFEGVWRAVKDLSDLLGV